MQIIVIADIADIFRKFFQGVRRPDEYGNALYELCRLLPIFRTHICSHSEEGFLSHVHIRANVYDISISVCAHAIP